MKFGDFSHLNHAMLISDFWFMSSQKITRKQKKFIGYKLESSLQAGEARLCVEFPRDCQMLN